jgi:cytochrome c peroxidase
MSRTGKISFAAIVGGILLVPLVNLWPRPVVEVTGSASGSEFEPVSRRLERSCADCHGRDVGRLPWYARLPGAKKLVERDRAGALNAWAIDRAELAGQRGFTDTDLAELEGALGDRTMPPRRYLGLHWNARLGEGERRSIALWIRSVRARAPEASAMAPARRGDPLVPLTASHDLDPVKTALGERLFHDRRLSADDRISCASCHNLKRGGTDQTKLSRGVHQERGQLNAPTVFNASFSASEYWDGRARDLRQQARDAMENLVEMGSSSADVVRKLERDETYRAEFQRAYPSQGVSTETVADALACFEESLVTVDAPFDDYLRGDERAIGPAEKAGYRLFLDLGCSACHFGPAVGGRRQAIMGKRGNYFGDRGGESDADLGRYRVTGSDLDRHRFKVPTLRNVALTFPYFHDGSTSSLVEAVNTMARYELGRELSAAEAGDVVKFLESLTGKYRGRPLGRP